MRKLVCISTDNYQYEGESLDFFYNNILIFNQFNRSLNRGGKTLVLRDLTTNEEIVSSGYYMRGEKWWRKISSELKELSYEIEWKDIEDACKKRRKLNKDSKLSEVIRQQTLNNKELEKTEKRLIHLRKQIKENKTLIKILQSDENI